MCSYKIESVKLKKSSVAEKKARSIRSLEFKHDENIKALTELNLEVK